MLNKDLGERRFNGEFGDAEVVLGLSVRTGRADWLEKKRKELGLGRTELR